MPTPGPFELIVILVIALVIIGPGRLPDVGAALGKSIREFRKASSDISDAARVETAPLPPAAPAQTAAPAPTPAQVQTAAPAPIPPVQTAAPAPTPEPSVPAPTSTTVPAPIAAPPNPADDESTNLPA
jgi:TatA/E family protein of Tat protein translocase